MIKVITKIKDIIKKNIIEIIKGTAPSWKYVVCYIGVIFLFAIIYTFLPNSFYHSTVQYESSLSMDENDILNDIKKNIIKSQKDYTDEKIQVNEKVYIDGNKTSIDSLKYEEKNEVSFEVDICTNEETNDDIALGAARRKFTFSLDNNIKEFNKDSKSYIYYFILTPDVSSDNSDIFGYKDIELYKALFPAKLINGYDSPNILMTMDSESFNKINNLKNAKNGFPSGISNNFERMFYLSAVTITTVGYGDIVPITTIARTLISVEAISGAILVGLFLNSLSLRTSNSISKAEKEKEEEKILPVKVAMYREIQIFLSRIVSIWSDVHYYSVPKSEPSNIEELFSMESFDKMGRYLNLNGQPDIFPPTTWWYYFNSSGQEFIEKGEKILNRYNAYLDPEIFRYIHYLVEDSDFIIGMTRILDLRNYYSSNGIPRPQYLAAYYPMPDEEILNTIIKLFIWCEKIYTELTQKGYTVYKVSIRSSDTPKPSTMSSMMPPEEFEFQNQKYETWIDTNSHS